MKTPVFALAAFSMMGSMIGGVGCGVGSVDPDLTTPEDPGESIAFPTPPPSRNRAGDSLAANVQPAPKALTHQCRADAFCEDFESVDPATRWSSQVTTGGGTLAFMGPSASLGARSLHIATTPSAIAFLRKDGGVAEGGWWGAVGLTIRVATPPERRLAGPEIAVGDARIVLSYSRDTLVLEQRLGGAVVAAAVVGTPAFNAWQRVVLGLEVNQAAQAPYGRVEISVDGGDLVLLPLAVPLYGGARELRAGVTEADLAPSAVTLDDVMFFAK